MTGVDCNSYNLEKVLAGYTAIGAASDNTSLSDFRNALSSGLSQAFSNINLLLIYFTRARQTHKSLDKVISAIELEELQNNLDATAQFYYFVQLLGTHIHPDFEAIQRSGMINDIKGAAYTLLTFEHILGKINEHKVDMKEILENPTPSNLQKALVVLEFPKKCLIKSLFGYTSTDKEVEFATTQFFCLKGDYSKVRYSELEADYTFYRMSQNKVNGYKINNVLEKTLANVQEPEFFADMAQMAKEHLVALNDRVRLFHKLAQTPQSSFELNKVQAYFLKETFPIVLVSENEDKIKLFNNLDQEFRSITPLKLGSDIKIIATDTDDHRLEIMKFLELSDIGGVQFVLFSDLKKSKATKVRPSEPYHHEGGVPSLKWLCAQQIHKSNVPFKPAKPISSDTNGIYSEKNIAGATKLVNDAKKYSIIKFG